MRENLLMEAFESLSVTTVSNPEPMKQVQVQYLTERHSFTLSFFYSRPGSEEEPLRDRES